MKITEKRINEFIKNLSYRNDNIDINSLMSSLFEHCGDTTERLKRYVSSESRNILVEFETFCSKGN